MAYDLVAKRLREGTATSQETTHFLKRGSAREKLEMEKLREENKLLRAKTEAVESVQELKILYANAIDAMRGYSGDA